MSVEHVNWQKEHNILDIILGYYCQISIFVHMEHMMMVCRGHTRTLNGGEPIWNEIVVGEQLWGRGRDGNGESGEESEGGRGWWIVKQEKKHIYIAMFSIHIRHSSSILWLAWYSQRKAAGEMVRMCNVIVIVVLHCTSKQASLFVWNNNSITLLINS